MKIAILTQVKYIRYANAFIGELLELGMDKKGWQARIHVNHHSDHFDWREYDLVVSLLYDKIVKNNEFDIPRLGTINIHPSYLPWHRGSCPNFWAVLSGGGAGWTAHRMTAEIDRGDIYLQKSVPVMASDTAETLWDRLFDELPVFLFDLAEIMSSGNFEPLDIEQGNDTIRTIPSFNEIHDANNFLNNIWKQRGAAGAFSAMFVLDAIRACSFGDYPGFVLDTPDGKVEFKARRIEE